MTTSFILTVALSVVILLIILILIGLVLYQRWRISDNNVHLEKFITENGELHEKLNQYYKENNSCKK